MGYKYCPKDPIKTCKIALLAVIYYCEVFFKYLVLLLL